MTGLSCDICHRDKLPGRIVDLQREVAYCNNCFRLEIEKGKKVVKDDKKSK